MAADVASPVTMEDDPMYVAGYLMGTVREAVRRDRWVQAVVPAVCAETVMRIAEIEGLPFAAVSVDADTLEVTIGTRATQ